MIRSKLLEYKFKSIYRFVNIIYEYVEAGIEFWNFDGDQFARSATKFNEKSLLHVYVSSTLYNYYSEKFREDDINDEDEIYWWINLMGEYGVVIVNKEYHLDQDNPGFEWFQINEAKFKMFFEVVSDEVVHILFNDKKFLVQFNQLVQKVIKDEDRAYTNIIRWPDNSRNVDGTIKRCNIPIWVKQAVYHRDKGRCVFCNCDLNWIVNILRPANYDHIIPLKDYGANDPCNIQLTCEHCNKSKGTKDIIANYKYQSWW